MQAAKTVAAIHDLSGVGRCALTVVIPVISAMGVQVCPAPTAVLSAHTAFEGIAVHDLTDFLQSYLVNWTQMGLVFDAIYTGYLASPAQVEIVQAFLRDQPRAFRLIDPVMGDDGMLYRGMNPAMPERMCALCNGADLITPNMTEYALLTGEAYSLEARSEADARDMLCRLLERTRAQAALITSIPLRDGLANAYMTPAGTFGLIRFERLAVHYPGTGDLFASVIAGAMTRGAELAEATRIATDFVRQTIAVTMACATEINYGVQLEKTLSLLERETERLPCRE